MAKQLVTGKTETQNYVKVQHIGKITAYEVTEAELKALKSHGKNITQDICISTISIALTLLTSIFTCPLNGVRLGIFSAISGCFLIGGVIAFFIARKNKSDADKLYYNITHRNEKS